MGIFARVGIHATTNIVIFEGLFILCMIFFISVDGVDFNKLNIIVKHPIFEAISCKVRKGGLLM